MDGVHDRAGDRIRIPDSRSFLSPAPFSINGFARVWPLAFCVKVESGWNLAAGSSSLKPAGGGAGKWGRGAASPQRRLIQSFSLFLGG